MPPKKFALNQEHGYIGDKPKYKAKPRDLSGCWKGLQDYMLQRDRLIYRSCDEDSKKDILIRYGK
jgi:hypothetical protein